MENPIKHCYSNAMHTKAWTEMRQRQAELSGRGTGNDKAYADAEKKRTAPFNIKEEAYEKSNRKMRKDYKSETGKKLGSRQTSGTGKRRVSFACRFAGMAGAMKDSKGEPTRKAMALKKWGFGSVEAARNFCQKNKSKK
tara:strand:+ start:206 stop:622 length:417 start_codon:yes stop_codon:yes gene_type:complete